MPPHILSRLASTQQAAGPPPALLRTGFDYKSVWQEAHMRDDLQGQREADEDPDDLRSQPADDCDEDDLPDFDPPSSPLATPPQSPLLNAIIDFEDKIPDLEDIEENELTYDEIKALFGNNIINPTPFTNSRFTSPTSSSCASPDDASSATSETQGPSPEGSIIPSKRTRSSSAKAANRERKDKKKHEEIAERRDEGQLPVHGDAYVNRHTQSQFVSRDFSVLDYSAVSGGDTGKVGRSKASKSAKNLTLERAAQDGYSLFLWDGRCVFSLSSSLSRLMFLKRHYIHP